MMTETHTQDLKTDHGQTVHMLTEAEGFAIINALNMLQKAGENDEFSDGLYDPHVAEESYIDAMWRLKNLNEKQT